MNIGDPEADSLFPHNKLRLLDLALKLQVTTLHAYLKHLGSKFSSLTKILSPTKKMT